MEKILSTLLSLLLFIPVSAQESKSADGWSYSYDFIENGIKCVNINGKIFKNAFFTSFDNKGGYSYISWEKGKVYVNIGGKKLGPYEYVNGKNFEEVTPVVLADGGKYIFMFSQKGKQ